jgi:hypothetical protein
MGMKPPMTIQAKLLSLCPPRLNGRTLMDPSGLLTSVLGPTLGSAQRWTPQDVLSLPAPSPSLRPRTPLTTRTAIFNMQVEPGAHSHLHLLCTLHPALHRLVPVLWVVNPSLSLSRNLNRARSSSCMRTPSLSEVSFYCPPLHQDLQQQDRQDQDQRRQPRYRYRSQRAWLTSAVNSVQRRPSVVGAWISL